MDRILVCLPEVPNPRVSGGYGRNVAILRSLVRLGTRPTVLAMSSQRDGGASAMLAAEGIPVLALDRDGVDIAAVLSDGFDIVLITYFELAEQLLPYVETYASSARLIIDSVDLHYIRALRQGEIERDPQAAAKAEVIRRRELAVYRRAEVVLTVSETEQATLCQLLPNMAVGVVPSVHEADFEAPGPQSRRGTMFVGAYSFAPNHDAAVQICTEIAPRLRALGYEEPISLVGPYLDSTLTLLARNAGVEPVGFVEDLAPLYARHRVFLSPVRFGSGVKTKVGEALGAGLPVVGTVRGTEGFPADRSIVCDDDPAGLAAAVCALREDARWTEASQAGRELIAADYGAARADRELGEVLEYLAAPAAVA